MLSIVLTVAFYLAAIVIVCRRCESKGQALAIGTLPAIWISLLSLAGLFETLMGLPATFSIVAVVLASLVVAGRDLRSGQWLCRRPTGWISLLSLAGFTAAVVGTTAWVYHLDRWGGHDAMYTWVLRARFLFDENGRWINGFSNDLALLHPDYPPMFSWALSALWSLEGYEASAAAACLYFPIFPAWVMLMVGWWQAQNPDSKFRLTLPLACSIALPIAVRMNVQLTLDLVLAYAVAGSVAWFESGRRQSHPAPFAVASFLAAWASLLKNEGVLWLLVFTLTAAWLGVRRRSLTANSLPPRMFLRALAVGTAVPLVALLFFKLTLSPPSDLSDPSRVAQISEVVQPDLMLFPESIWIRVDQIWQWVRHRMTSYHLFMEVGPNWRDWGITLWMIPLLTICVLVNRKRSMSGILVAVLLQVAGYYFVYLITPYHPRWHLTTSLSRVLLHVVPAWIGIVGFAPRLPKENSNESSTYAHRWQLIGTTVAVCYLMVMSFFVVGEIKKLPIGQLEPPNFTVLKELEFPLVDEASYVSQSITAAELYRTQFSVVPTVLVVDRRAKILLGHFQNEEELRAYCVTNKWELQRNIDGLGWARDDGGEGLLQPGRGMSGMKSAQ